MAVGAAQHFKHVARDGQVAEHFESIVGSTTRTVVWTSTTQGAGYLSHTVASPVQSLVVSGVQMPVSDTPSGAWSRLPNLPERRQV